MDLLGLMRPQEFPLQVRDEIRSLALWGVVLAVTGIIGISYPALAAQQLEVATLPPNHASNETNCDNCHLGWDRRSLKSSHLLNRFTANHEDFDSRRAGQERTCRTCHTGVVEASHPTGVIPSRSLPPHLPLNDRGEMTCSTCHALEKNGEIRRKAGQSNQEFCESCHSASFFTRMADSGSSILTSGHLSVDKWPSGSADNYSRQCMNCHMDNARMASPGTAMKTAAVGSFAMGGGAANHSIGSTYSDFSMRRNYRPASALASEILLPEGKVSCLSCHKAYTQKHGEVTVARNLCTQCHNM